MGMDMITAATEQLPEARLALRVDQSDIDDMLQLMPHCVED